MASGLFAPDGCVIPNIVTRAYRVTFTAKCEHVKVLAAQVIIRAESAEDAESFARRWLHQGPLRGQTVVDEVTEVAS